MQVNAGMPRQSGVDVRGLVDREVVHDDVDLVLARRAPELFCGKSQGARPSVIYRAPLLLLPHLGVLGVLGEPHASEGDRVINKPPRGGTR